MEEHNPAINKIVKEIINFFITHLINFFNEFLFHQYHTCLPTAARLTAGRFFVYILFHQHPRQGRPDSSGHLNDGVI